MKFVMVMYTLSVFVKKPLFPLEISVYKSLQHKTYLFISQIVVTMD